MQTKVGKFSFAVPDGHPQAGEKVEKTFNYQVCETSDEAVVIMKDKKWSLVNMVNDNLKANARSNSYQTALLPYKPSEVSAEDIAERMVRDFIRLGADENFARATVQAMLAGNKA